MWLCNAPLSKTRRRGDASQCSLLVALTPMIKSRHKERIRFSKLKLKKYCPPVMLPHRKQHVGATRAEARASRPYTSELIAEYIWKPLSVKTSPADELRM